MARCLESIFRGNSVTTLAGFAGTGKTTLAGRIARESGLRTIFAAPTGKAAQVLTQKGFPARTIHSVMYSPPVEVELEQEHELKWDVDPFKVFDIRQAGLLVLDEASMIDEKLGADIMRVFHGIPIIAVGDPAQLSPVRGRSFFMSGEPDALLTDVVRNSGEILRMATDIRSRGIWMVRRYPAINLRSVGESHAGEYDQIIVGRNRTRDYANAKVRRLRGYDDSYSPVNQGERIVCLKNNSEIGVVNGQQFFVRWSDGDDWGGGPFETIRMELECTCSQGSGSGSGRCYTCGWYANRLIPVYAGGFLGSDSERKLNNSWSGIVATYAYAITAHKAQGSEWDSVLVVNESGVFGAEAGKWLYTAVTRAKKELAIIDPPKNQSWRQAGGHSSKKR